MKNLFSIKTILLAILFVCTMFGASAQSTKPRWGTGINDNNTGSALQYKYITATDAVGADTTKLAPRSFMTIVNCTNVVDSIAFSATVTNAYVGDRIVFLATNSAGSGHLVKFVGANWSASSTGPSVTLTSSKKANIEWVFDGTIWVETQRVTQ